MLHIGLKANDSKIPREPGRRYPIRSCLPEAPNFPALLTYKMMPQPRISENLIYPSGRSKTIHENNPDEPQDPRPKAHEAPLKLLRINRSGCSILMF